MADLRHLGRLDEILDHPQTAGQRAGRLVRFRLPRRLKWRDWVCFGAYLAALVLVAYLVSGLHVHKSRSSGEVHREERPNSTVPRALPVVDVPAIPSDPLSGEDTRVIYGVLGAVVGSLVLAAVLLFLYIKFGPGGPTNRQRRGQPNGVAIPLRDLNPANSQHGGEDQQPLRPSQPDAQAGPSRDGPEEPEARHSTDTAVEEPPVYEA